MPASNASCAPRRYVAAASGAATAAAAAERRRRTTGASSAASSTSRTSAAAGAGRNGTSCITVQIASAWISGPLISSWLARGVACMS